MGLLLLPWRRFAVTTSWSPPDVERELRRTVERSIEPADRAWCGSVRHDGFRLRRGVRPGVIVAGEVRPVPNGSRVTMTVRLPTASMVLVSAWMLAVVLLALSLIATGLGRREGIVVLPLVWPLWALPGVRQFQRDARDAESILRDFFPAPPPPACGPFR